MNPDPEFNALVESIKRNHSLAAVGTCAFIGPDLRMCGQPERSKGTGLCLCHFSIVKAVRMAERMEPCI